MTTIAFYCASDDLFEIEGDGISMEACDIDGTHKVTVMLPDGKGFIVGANYGNMTNDATWLIGVAPLGEDHPIASVDMRFQLDGNGYSPRLLIDLPEGTIIDNGTDKGVVA